MIRAAPEAVRDRYDAVLVGSGFGSLFFLEGLLVRRPQARVLVLERGQHHPVAWQLAQQRSSVIDPRATFRVPPGHKPDWDFTVGLGGGTNCWYAQTPRFHPNDFRTASLYGVGRDWPVGYDELEPYYVRAERRMAVSGSEVMGRVLPRSAPFPLPPHRVTRADELMQAAQPERHFAIATARASVKTPERNRCCSTGTCRLCPANAKFNFENGFAALLKDPRVTIVTGAEVTHLEHAGGRASAALFRHGEREYRARGELLVLGANGIHSPAILLRSGLDHPTTGRGIHEQIGYYAEAELDGLDHFDGGTLTTGLNYSLYDGDFRRTDASALLYFENRWVHGLRKTYGRWRQVLPLTIAVEDLPQDDNRVLLDADGMPVVHHARNSEYGERGVQRSFDQLARVLAPLPVERIVFRGLRPTESHVQGSLRMGRDPANSVVDADQVHHAVRNLVVVGSSVFPTGPCANPSLTVAAMSLRSAERVV